MDPVRIGDVPSGVGTPEAFVLVEDDAPILRIDVHSRTDSAFAAVMVWNGLVVIGFGESVHFVSIDSRHAVTNVLDSYFGHLYATHDRLLATDAARVHCFPARGSRVWRSDVLGIDGVVVKKTDDGAIEGEGEWDPPGGW